MKHIIDIATEDDTIYIDGYRVVGDKPCGLFDTRTILANDKELKRIIKRCKEVLKSN